MALQTMMAVLYFSPGVQVAWSAITGKDRGVDQVPKHDHICLVAFVDMLPYLHISIIPNSQ